MTVIKSKSGIGKVILGLLIVIVGWIIVIIAASWLSILVDWFNALDDAISAEFLATLGGLVLAAATLMISTVEQRQKIIADAESRSDEARIKVSNAEIVKLDPLLNSIDDQTKTRLRGLGVSSDAIRYGELYVDYVNSKSPLDSLVKGRDDFLKSFFWLIGCLALALTLDFWAESTPSLVEPGRNITRVINSANRGILSLLDTLSASTMVSLALYYLVNGTMAFRSGNK